MQRAVLMAAGPASDVVMTNNNAKLGRAAVASVVHRVFVPAVAFPPERARASRSYRPTGAIEPIKPFDRPRLDPIWSRRVNCEAFGLPAHSFLHTIRIHAVVPANVDQSLHVPSCASYRLLYIIRDCKVRLA